MEFNLPETLSDLTDEALSDLLDEGVAAFRALGITEDSDESTIAEGERIAPAIRAIRDEQQARVAAAESRRSRAAELLATVPEQTAEDAEEQEEAPEAEPEPAVEQEATTTIENEESIVDDVTPVPVAASAQSPVARAAAHAPAPVVEPEVRPFSIVASADVPGVPAGSEMEGFAAVGQAVVARLRGLGGGQPATTRQRFGAAVIRTNPDVMQDRGGDDMALLTRAGDQSRLPGGALVAAGGWCAPSTTVYDILTLETASGLLDLPEFGVSRGGIRYTPGPDFSSIASSCGFSQTEAQAISGECKTCCEVPCPSFTDVRLEAVGLCVKVPILTEAGYPELVTRFTEGALVAHAQKKNAWALAKMVAAAGTAVVPAVQGAVSFMLDAIEWEAVSLRQKLSMAPEATIEVVFPEWYRTLLRIDVARRNGQDWNSVTFAQVDSNFNLRNIRPQFVRNLQDLTVPARPGATPTAVPATAKALMYPAGTWSRGTDAVISIDGVYDSVGLESNTYTGLFVEEGQLVVQRSGETWALTLDTRASGLTGEQKAVALGTAFA